MSTLHLFLKVAIVNVSPVYSILILVVVSNLSGTGPFSGPQFDGERARDGLFASWRDMLVIEGLSQS